MTIHELLSNTAGGCQSNKIKKKAQTQQKGKCFIKPGVQDEAWKRNGSSKCKIEKEIIHSIAPVFKWQ